MKKAVIMLVGLSLATSASAATWKYVTTSNSGSDYYLDISSVRNSKDYSGGYRLAWFKTDDSQNNSEKRRSAKFLYRAKCDNYQLGLAQAIEYDAADNVIDSTSSSYVTYTVVAPETVGYSLLTAMCWGTTGDD